MILNRPSLRGMMPPRQAWLRMITPMSQLCPQCHAPGWSVPGIVSRGTRIVEEDNSATLLLPTGQGGLVVGFLEGSSETEVKTALAAALEAPSIRDGEVTTGVEWLVVIFWTVTVGAVILGALSWALFSWEALRDFVPFLDPWPWLAQQPASTWVKSVLLWAAIGAAIGWARWALRDQVQRRHQEAQEQRQDDQARHRAWEHLLYCKRDHVVFDPTTSTSEVATREGVTRLLDDLLHS